MSPTKIPTLGIGLENKRDRKVTARGVRANAEEYGFMKFKSS